MIYYRKKDSNKKHYIKVAVLIILITISILNPSVTNFSSNITRTVSKPIYDISSFINYELEEIVDYTIGKKSNRDRVNELTQENQKLLQENIQLKDIINNSEALKKEFEFVNKVETKSARVISMNSGEYFSKFTINKGAKDGIKRGDIVLSDYSSKSDNIVGALLGRIDEVSHNTALVSTILDEKYNFTFIHSKSRGFGIVNDRVLGQFTGHMFDVNEKVEVGDLIYTSGIGGIYKNGIYIGKIKEVKLSDDKITKFVKIDSPINFKKIYKVFVISNQGEIDE